MREAPVGWQCVSCIKADSLTSPVARWRPSRSIGSLGNSRVTPVVIALVIINVVAYLYQRGHATFSFEVKYYLVPMEVHHHLYDLITSAFFHASGTHILLNMVSLLVVGPALEAEIGPARFGVLYFLSAVGGSIGYYLLAPANQAGFGASGAIFGLFGAYLVLAWLRGWEIQRIIGLLVLNVLFSFTPGVGWQDHLGGGVTGMLVCLGLMYAPSRSGMRRPSSTTQVVQTVATVVASLIVMGLLLQIQPGHVNV